MLHSLVKKVTVIEPLGLVIRSIWQYFDSLPDFACSDRCCSRCWSRRRRARWAAPRPSSIWSSTRYNYSRLKVINAFNCVESQMAKSVTDGSGVILMKKKYEQKTAIHIDSYVKICNFLPILYQRANTFRR